MAEYQVPRSYEDSGEEERLYLVDLRFEFDATPIEAAKTIAAVEYFTGGDIIDMFDDTGEYPELPHLTLEQRDACRPASTLGELLQRNTVAANCAELLTWMQAIDPSDLTCDHARALGASIEALAVLATG